MARASGTSGQGGRRARGRGRLSRLGDRFSTWFTGAMLGIACWLILTLIALILVRGLGALWPKPIWQIELAGGTRYLGLAHATEALHEPTPSGEAVRRRTLWRIGNRDLYGQGFVWVNDHAVVSRTRPKEAVALERLEWGPFLGFVREVKTPAGRVAGDRERVWAALQRELGPARERFREIRHIERKVVGDLSGAMERHRLAIRRLEVRGRRDSPQGARAAEEHQAGIDRLRAEYEGVSHQLQRLRQADREFQVVFEAVAGGEKRIPISAVVRVHQPNQLSWWGKAGVYLDRIREFIFEEPREANSEGGVAPAIFGTVMMTLIMVVAVVPLGVMAALYLHEYAKPGPLVSTVRIAVNNLAGVPSIVFGVFGLGFFCYLIGGTMDQLFFPERLPAPTFGGGGILWASLTLALLTVPVVIVATEEALAAVPNGQREASFACGANKFQTIWNVVLPAALPGILTGAILAMARGAGEVAPLMITGIVKLAPELPVDAVAPFVHLERRFMHLGFHIYDVGFQSPDVEASKPMVYMTALLLMAIVLCLNLGAMRIRTRLRLRFQGAKV